MIDAEWEATNPPMCVFVFHPDDPYLKMLPEGTMVIIQRHVYTPNEPKGDFNGRMANSKTDTQ